MDSICHKCLHACPLFKIPTMIGSLTCQVISRTIRMSFRRSLATGRPQLRRSSIKTSSNRVKWTANMLPLLIAHSGKRYSKTSSRGDARINYFSGISAWVRVISFTFRQRPSGTHIEFFFYIQLIVRYGNLHCEQIFFLPPVTLLLMYIFHGVVYFFFFKSV